MRCWARTATSTSFASRRTFRCRETPGCVRRGNLAAISPAFRLPPVRKSRTARRVGSEIAKKTSVVTGVLTSPEPFLKLGEKGLGEAHEVGLAHPDLVARLELQDGLLRREAHSRTGGVRPTGQLVDLQLAPVEQHRVAKDADLIQRIAVFALDAGEPMHEHVVQEEDLVVEEARLELLGGCLADPLAVRAQIGVDPRTTRRDVILRVFLHPEQGIIPSIGSWRAAAA